MKFEEKELQHDFRKIKGGGVKGRLELFRKLIRFGTVTCPSAVVRFPSAKVVVGCVIWKSWLIAICAVDNTVQFMIKLEL